MTLEKLNMGLHLKNFVLFLVLQGIYCKTIPSFIQKCHRNDPNVAACIQNSVEHLKPYLEKGIPELDVPPIEPFKLPEINIDNGGGFVLKLQDIEAVGAKDFEVTKFKADVPNHIYRFGIKIPTLNAEGNYDVNARTFIVPIVGNGRFQVNATDIDGQAVLSGAVFTGPDGRKYMEFNDLNVKLEIGGYKIHLDNLFGGDPVLSQTVDLFLNQNTKDIMPIIIPYIERKTEEIGLQIAKNIVKDVEYDEVFPER